jgi:hypothetical protein
VKVLAGKHTARTVLALVADGLVHISPTVQVEGIVLDALAATPELVIDPSAAYAARIPGAPVPSLNCTSKPVVPWNPTAEDGITKFPFIPKPPVRFRTPDKELNWLFQILFCAVPPTLIAFSFHEVPHDPAASRDA